MATLYVFPGVIRCHFRLPLMLMTVLGIQVGPRDPDRHSKLPYFLRLHGGVLPKMILPLAFMTAWSTLITCISVWVHNRGSNPFPPRRPLILQNKTGSMILIENPFA